ncbi:MULTISPECIES: hypothetical protein [unclassified Thioalkalivibrio]|uniref:hypothetical protein n=1 Tax=unclassified Thioalkalivibrio TaxID=2621013 RepID=UPI0009DA3748|nr:MULTISPECIES: hypothetical protein [unclassified Thioalkalivibrio]
MKARSSNILGTLGPWPLRAAPAKRAPGGVGCDERSESHQGVARRGERCVSLRSTAPYGIPSVLTFSSRMKPLAEGVMGRPVNNRHGALDV